METPPLLVGSFQSRASNDAESEGKGRKVTPLVTEA